MNDVTTASNSPEYEAMDDTQHQDPSLRPHPDSLAAAEEQTWTNNQPLRSNNKQEKCFMRSLTKIRKASLMWIQGLLNTNHLAKMRSTHHIKDHEDHNTQPRA